MKLNLKSRLSKIVLFGSVLVIPLGGIGAYAATQTVNQSQTVEKSTTSDSSSDKTDPIAATTSKTATGKTVNLYENQKVKLGETKKYSIKMTYPDNEGKFIKDAGAYDEVPKPLIYQSVKAFDEAGKDVTSTMFNLTGLDNGWKLTAKNPATLMGATITYEVTVKAPDVIDAASAQYLNKDGEIEWTNIAHQFYNDQDKPTPPATLIPPTYKDGGEKYIEGKTVGASNEAATDSSEISSESTSNAGTDQNTATESSASSIAEGGVAE